MPDWLVDFLKWGASGGVVGGAAWLMKIRRDNAATNSDVTRHRVADSDLEYDKRERRDAIADRDKTIAQLRADYAMRGIEIIDLHKKNYDIVQQLAGLQGQMRAEQRLRAKAAIRIAAERPRMEGVEVDELERITGFGDPDF